MLSALPEREPPNKTGGHLAAGQSVHVWEPQCASPMSKRKATAVTTEPRPAKELRAAAAPADLRAVTLALLRKRAAGKTC